MTHPRHDWNLHPYSELPTTFICYGTRTRIDSRPGFGIVSYKFDPDYGAAWSRCNLACNESVWLVPQIGFDH